MYKRLLALAKEETESLREETDRLRAENRELRAAIPPPPSLTDDSGEHDDDDRRPQHRARGEAINTLRQATIARLEARLRSRLAEYEAMVASQAAQIRDLQEALNQAWLVSRALVQARRAANN